MSSQSFAGLGVSKPLVGALAARGITEPFAVQRLVIADVLAGHDVLAQSPTGSGKTLAFGLPLIDRLQPRHPRPSALILAPTRELACQIVDELQDMARAGGLKIAPVYGGVGLDRQAVLAATAHVVVATPGRLEDLIERRMMRLDQIRMLVLDEADRMLDMGFKPAVDRIVAQTPAERQTLFFSATLGGDAGRVAKAYTRRPRVHVHEPERDRAARVEHRFLHVAHDAKLGTLVAELQGKRAGRTLVFVRTKRGADRLVKRLAAHDVQAVAMHGDKTQSHREKALAGFQAGRVNPLIATDVAARGIDVTDITKVINFDSPNDRDAYVHRVGRTARAGRAGTGVSLVTPDETKDMGRVAQDLGLSPEFDRERSGNGRNGESRISESRNGGKRNGAQRNGTQGNSAQRNGNAGGRRRRRRS
jgi:ATP-dependent RNA helicase RhlE